jgi:hypothetical protein
VEWRAGGGRGVLTFSPDLIVWVAWIDAAVGSLAILTTPTALIMGPGVQDGHFLQQPVIREFRMLKPDPDKNWVIFLFICAFGLVFIFNWVAGGRG